MKPTDFFIGAMEFFAILVPGAVLAFLLMPWRGAVFGPLLPAVEPGLAGWVAFAVVAFVLGHVLHHAGSVLDTLYDREVRRRRRFGDEWAYARAKAVIRRRHGIDDRADVSYFQWAGSAVRARSDAAAAELDRNGGESKFFRSLSLTSALAAVLWVGQGQWVAAAAAALLAWFSYRRFVKRRWDATQLTYQYYLLLEDGGSAGAESAARPAGG
ncbi:MAG: hypothetical protein J0L57_04490 [Burkholderiales bacterium]|nr:hypothetical protein [Burkholderiales bacterium]